MRAFTITLIIAVLSITSPSIKADPGITVKRTICVNGTCYIEYCHDTGYCWIQQAK